MNKKKHFEDSEKCVAMRVSGISIFANVLLSILKFIAGIVAHSGAMISDAVNSASDVFSTFVVIIGIQISSKSPDQEHPYGHERLECVAANFLAFILAATGIGIGYSGVKKIIGGSYEQLSIPGTLALIAAIISILVKEWLFWYTRAAAKKIKSDALMADAWHHRSDALSSIGSFIGIFAARIGFPVFDPVASVLICLFVLKAAYDIAKDATDKMVDKACPKEIEDKMRQVILQNPEVMAIDELKTRLFGTKIYAEVEILLDGRKRLVEAHEVAEQVHDSIEREFEDVKHCMVHVNPYMK